MTIVLDQAQRRTAQAFFGYFPDWQTFSRDLATHRDERSREEGFVRTALEYLADMVGRTHTDLLGLYFTAHAKNDRNVFARDELMRCYDAGYRTFYGKPSGAFPAAELDKA